VKAKLFGTLALFMVPTIAFAADAGSGPTSGATSTNDAGSGPTKGATQDQDSGASNSLGSTENSAGVSPGPKSTGGSQPVTPAMPEKK
jgi:hypothetical protein